MWPVFAVRCNFDEPPMSSREREEVMTDIVSIMRSVSEEDAYAEPWTFRQHCLDAAAEIERLRGPISQLAHLGAMVLRDWHEHDCMDVEGCDIQAMAEKAGVIELVPYSIEKHGEYMRDAWDTEEGDSINSWAAGVADAIDHFHRPLPPESEE